MSGCVVWEDTMSNETISFDIVTVTVIIVTQGDFFINENYMLWIHSENFAFTCCSKRSDGARRRVVRVPEKLHRTANTLWCFKISTWLLLYTEQHWIQKLDTWYTVSSSLTYLCCFPLLPLQSLQSEIYVDAGQNCPWEKIATYQYHLKGMTYAKISHLACWMQPC